MNKNLLFSTIPAIFRKLREFKQFTLLLLIVLTVSQTSFAQTWNNSSGERFGVYVDKRWQFSDNGRPKADNSGAGRNLSNPGVTMTDFPGTIAFHVWLWQNKADTPADHNMINVSIWLKNTSNNQEIQLTSMDVSGNVGGDDSWNGNYNLEGNPQNIRAYNGSVDYVQKRMYDDYNRQQYGYFHVNYNNAVRDFIVNAGANLRYRVAYTWWWNERNSANDTKDLNQRNLLPNTMSAPTIINHGWSERNGKTIYTIDWSSNASERNGYYYDKIRAGGGYGETYRYDHIFQDNTTSTPQIVDDPDDNTNMNKITAAKLSRTYGTYYWYKVNVAKRYRAGNAFYINNVSQGEVTVSSGASQFQSKQFCYPNALTADDNSDGTVRLNWSVPTTTDANRDNSHFEIQRSQYSDFRQIDKTINSSENEELLYDPSKDNYTYIDVLDNQLREKGEKTYYYRIRRTNAAWDYPAIRCSRIVNTNYKRITTLTWSNPGTGKVKLAWGLTNGMFPDGELQFSLTNTYSNTTITPDKNALTYEEFSIPTCTPTTFILKILKGAQVISEKSIKVMLPNTISGEIEKLSASKGYFSDRVILSWDIAQDKENLKYYVISRKEVNDNSDIYMQLATINHTPGVRNYRYENPNLVPGTYYYYKVEGYQECNDSIASVTSKQEIGFSQPYGTISGRVTYTGSTAVKDVTVRVEGTEAVKNRSIFIPKGNWGVMMSADKAKNIFTELEGSIQFWNKSTLNEYSYIQFQRGLSWAFSPYWNAIKFGTPEESQLFYARPTANQIDTAVYKGFNTYNHHTLTYKSTDSINYEIKLYVNGTKTYTFNWTRTKNRRINSDVGDFGSLGTNNYLDEIRLWNVALSEADVKNNYDRYLMGKENGLTGYFRCDETVPNALFDVSRKDNTYNERHINLTNVKRESINVPTGDQLALKTYTDKNGNYLMSNIPYIGDGSQYTITPSYGVHEFNPSNRPLYFNASANTHNSIDFVDVSSFKVIGKVTYAGGEYPVEGVQINIDGIAANKDGKLITTDAEGKYEVSVPIGKHFITIGKQGHTFANKGRYPALENTYHVFEQPISNLNFTDSTLVKIAGRVSGGEREGKKPLGFAQSNANLGKATVVLQPTDTRYYLNTSDADIQINNNNPQIKNTTKIRAKVNNNQIIIDADPETGEFLALLPPIPYNVSDVYTTNSTGGQVLNKTNFRVEAIASLKPDVNQLKKDSSMVNGKMQSFDYHQKLNVNYRVDPQFEVTDLKSKKAIFGDSIYVYEGDYGRSDTISLYSVAGNNVTYNMGYPVFKKDSKYTWKIYAYEKYTNGTTGKEDMVPLADGKIDIDNALASHTVFIERNDSLGNSQTQLTLDSLGTAKYVFQAGFPNFSNDHLLKAKISYNAQGKIVTWPSEANPFKGYVFGSIPEPGSNFVTKGPEIVEFVIRDPAGSNSYAYLEKGSTFVKNISVTKGGGVHTELTLNQDLGTKQTVGVGFGVMVIQDFEVIANMSEKWDQTITRDNGHTSTTTEVNLTRIETSDSEDFVGAMADLYIGTSTNLLYGMTNKLALFPSETASGITSENGKSFKLEKQNILATDLEFSTKFNYTQNHITGYLIPNLKMLRNSIIRNGVDSVGFVNLTNQPVYFSKVSRDAENFGEPGTYSKRLPQNLPVGKMVRDTILAYNNWIKGWEKAIADNEKTKLDFFKKTPENLSFDAGAKIEKSKLKAKNEIWTTTITNNNEISVSGELGFEVLGIGMSVEVLAGGLVNYESVDEASTENSTTFGYVLADNNQGDYYSVDVFDTEDAGSFIFRTRGGQSSCPYEAPDTAKYFEPEKNHILSNGTFQIEKPQIYISGSKNATAENISTGREATFDLQLSNLSAANMAVTYQLAVREGSNPNGLILSIDGTPLTTPRLFQIAAGSTVTKTLKVRQSSLDVLDYKNLTLLFTSSCQNDPSADMGWIADSARINVQFVPSSSPITLKLPTTLINKENENPKITYQVSDYERGFKNFASVRLQYKDENEQDWRLVREFVNDKNLIPITSDNTEITASTFTYDFDVKNVPDGRYDVRAITVSKIGTDEIYVSTPVQKVIKDVVSPQVLGNPAPVTGILTPDGEISVMFNEDIRSNLMTENFLTVRSVLNGYELDHNVGVKLNGNAAYTEASVALADKSFSVEAWIKRDLGKAGTLIAHGNTFKLGFTADDKVTVTMGNEIFTSGTTVPSDGWQYISFAYDNDIRSFAVRALYETTSTVLFANQGLTDAYKGSGRLYVGTNADGSNAFNGALHNLSLWNKFRTMADNSVDKNTAKTGRETGLIGYWNMNEGHGTVATDVSRGRHLTLPSNNSWYLHNINYAPAFTGSNSIQLPSGTIPIASDENFALEFWFLGNTQTNATLFSVGDGIDDVKNTDKLAIGFDADGKLALRAKGTSIQISNANYLDNNWHHFALNVIRGGYSVAYLDGNVVKEIPSSNIGAVNYGDFTLGASKYLPRSGFATTDKFFTGKIDEVRVWKSTLSSSVLKLNRYNRLTGAEKGLAAYYPFERSYVDTYSQSVTESTLKGFTQNAESDAASTGTTTFDKTNVPPLKEARSTENVAHTFTASNNKVVVNITEPTFRIEGATLEMTLTRVSDLNGNVMNPVSWTSYIDLNRLKWSDDNVNFTQEHLTQKTREVTISNQSGKEENWVISNIPAWLKVSKMQGTLKPLASEKITLTSLNSTPIGSYEENIYLTGNNRIPEQLPVSLKVTGTKPNWSVNPNDFEFTMSLVGTLKVEGVPSEDTEDILAAFIDNTCVGVASPSFFKNQNMFYTMSNMYGSTEMIGKSVAFKLWDASTGRIYPVVTASQEITCSSDAIYGSLSNPVVFDAVDKVEQQISLGKGWNWISFNVTDVDMSPKSVFASVQSSTELAKDKTSMTMPSGTDWVGTLETIKIGDMYKVKETAPAVLNFTGISVKPSESPITLNTGWNWIGYTPQGTLPLTSALADITPAEGDLIKGKNAFSIFNGTEWVGLLNYLAPGNGYMFKSAASHTFRYPTSFSGMNRMKSEADAYQAYFASNSSKYSGNMNIIAQVQDEKGNVLKNLEVGAFVGEDCRGSEITRAMDLVFLTIAGDDERNDYITFRVYNPVTGTVSEVKDNHLKFSNDAIVGSLQAPYIVKMPVPTGLSDLNNSEISIYPTITNSKVYVQSENSVLSKIIVTDLNGKMVIQVDEPTELNTLDVGTLASGVYFVTVITKDDSRVVKRVIKK